MLQGLLPGGTQQQEQCPTTKFLPFTCSYGMTALLPDYALLCCCAGGGLGRVSCEHLACLVALEVPVAVVVTKVRFCSAACRQCLMVHSQAHFQGGACGVHG